MEIVGRYTAILDRIAVKPSSEKQLADLRDFIEESKATIEELQLATEDNRTLLALLELYRYPLAVEDMVRAVHGRLAGLEGAVVSHLGTPTPLFCRVCRGRRWSSR